MCLMSILLIFLKFNSLIAFRTGEQVPIGIKTRIYANIYKMSYNGFTFKIRFNFIHSIRGFTKCIFYATCLCTAPDFTSLLPLSLADGLD